MKIALLLRILVMKILVNVGQMHDVLRRQILVKQGRAVVVRMMNAPKHNIVALANAKVFQLYSYSPNLLKYLFFVKS